MKSTCTPAARSRSKRRAIAAGLLLKIVLATVSRPPCLHRVHSNSSRNSCCVSRLLTAHTSRRPNRHWCTGEASLPCNSYSATKRAVASSRRNRACEPSQTLLTQWARLLGLSGCNWRSRALSWRSQRTPLTLLDVSALVCTHKNKRFTQADLPRVYCNHWTQRVMVFLSDHSAHRQRPPAQ